MKNKKSDKNQQLASLNAGDGYMLSLFQKRKLELKKHVEFCGIQAQKTIGSNDFAIWEERRKDAEQEIRELIKGEYNVEYEPQGNNEQN